MSGRSGAVGPQEGRGRPGGCRHPSRAGFVDPGAVERWPWWAWALVGFGLGAVVYSVVVTVALMVAG